MEAAPELGRRPWQPGAPREVVAMPVGPEEVAVAPAVVAAVVEGQEEPVGQPELVEAD